MKRSSNEDFGFETTIPQNEESEAEQHDEEMEALRMNVRSSIKWTIAIMIVIGGHLADLFLKINTPFPIMVAILWSTIVLAVGFTIFLLILTVKVALYQKSQREKRETKGPYDF